MRIFCASVVFLLLASVVAAQPPTPAPEGGFRGRGGPGVDRGSFQRRDVPLLPDRPIPGRMVSLETLIAETDSPIDQPTATKILDLQKAQKLVRVAQIRLAALEELPTFAKFSELAPRVVGQTATRERTLPNYSDINIGTTVQVTFRMDEKGDALIQIYVERSRLAKAKEMADGASEPRRVETLSIQGTVRARLGEPVLVGSGPLSSESDANGWVVLTVKEL